MVTTLSAVGPLWGDGVTLAGQALRLLTVSALLPASSGVQVAGGVHPGAGTPLKVTSAGGMTTSVAPGYATAQGTVSGTQGAYRGALTTAGTLTHATSDPANPRNDLVVFVVVDNGDNTSTATVQIVAGTPAASPSDPAVPANSVKLARVAIPANASAVGTITDLRAFCAALGGIVPCTSFSGPAQPYDGMAIYETDTDVLAIYDGSAYVQVGASGAPRGLIAKGRNTVVPTGFTTSADVVQQSLSSVPMIAGRRYRITSYLPIGNNNATQVAGDLMRFKHKIGSTVKNTDYASSQSALQGLIGNSIKMITLVDDATTGTFTITATGANASGSGNHQVIVDNNAATLMQPPITVEDLGTGG